MKTRVKTNPLEGKTPNGNDEPWLTMLELMYAAEAVNPGYSKWKLEMLKRR